RGLRIQNPPPGIDEIMCCDRLTIRPQMIPQMESPDLAVRRKFPALRGAGNWPRARIFGGQPHQQLADDVELPGALNMMGIEAGELRAIAEIQHAGRDI